MKKKFRYSCGIVFSLILCPILLISCSTANKVSLSPPLPVQSIPYERNTKAKTSNGSLWSSTSKYTYLIEDHRARNIGDIITIIISESASGSKEAKTKTQRKSGVSAGITNFFGVADPWFGDNHASLLKAGMDNSYEGDGLTTRKEQMVAKITARVVDKMPNGDLAVEGRRELILNGEKQIIFVRGTVRPADISTDNTVKSENVADAQIEYGGTGVVSERQFPGWLFAIFNWLWPF